MRKENVNNSALIIIFSLLLLIFIFFKDFYNIEALKKMNSKIGIKNKYINHIFFAIDTRNFLKNKKLNNINSQYQLSTKTEYSQLLKKIFLIINECIKNQIFTITIDLFNSYDISLMDYQEIKEFTEETFFWKLIEEYATNMKLNISFFYSKDIPDCLIKKMHKFNDKNNTNKNQFNIKINFLVGFDIHQEIENKINQEIQENPKKKINFKKIICQITPPIDLAIILSKAELSTALFLNIYNNKIIWLNYSLNKINKNTINLLLKKSAHQIDPFF